MNKVDLKKKINDLFIVRENDGTYNLFGKYIIKQENETYKVIYSDENIINIFSSLKHAVTWCVFEKNNQQKEVKRIIELDECLASLNAMILQQTAILKKSKDISDREILYAKLCEGKLKKRQALSEIEKYATISRHMQNKKYVENTLKR